MRLSEGNIRDMERRQATQRIVRVGDDVEVYVSGDINASDSLIGRVTHATADGCLDVALARGGTPVFQNGDLTTPPSHPDGIDIYTTDMQCVRRVPGSINAGQNVIIDYEARQQGTDTWERMTSEAIVLQVFPNRREAEVGIRGTAPSDTLVTSTEHLTPAGRQHSRLSAGTSHSPNPRSPADAPLSNGYRSSRSSIDSGNSIANTGSYFSTSSALRRGDAGLLLGTIGGGTAPTQLASPCLSGEWGLARKGRQELEGCLKLHHVPHERLVLTHESGRGKRRRPEAIHLDGQSIKAKGGGTVQGDTLPSGVVEVIRTGKGAKRVETYRVVQRERKGGDQAEGENGGWSGDPDAPAPPAESILDFTSTTSDLKSGKLIRTFKHTYRMLPGNRASPNGAASSPSPSPQDSDITTPTPRGVDVALRLASGAPSSVTTNGVAHSSEGDEEEEEGEEPQPTPRQVLPHPPSALSTDVVLDRMTLVDLLGAEYDDPAEAASWHAFAGCVTSLLSSGYSSIAEGAKQGVAPNLQIASFLKLARAAQYAPLSLEGYAELANPPSARDNTFAAFMQSCGFTAPAHPQPDKAAAPLPQDTESEHPAPAPTPAGPDDDDDEDSEDPEVVAPPGVATQPRLIPAGPFGSKSEALRGYFSGRHEDTSTAGVPECAARRWLPPGFAAAAAAAEAPQAPPSGGSAIAPSPPASPATARGLPVPPRRGVGVAAGEGAPKPYESVMVFTRGECTAKVDPSADAAAPLRRLLRPGAPPAPTVAPAYRNVLVVQDAEGVARPPGAKRGRKGKKGGAEQPQPHRLTAVLYNNVPKADLALLLPGADDLQMPCFDIASLVSSAIPAVLMLGVGLLGVVEAVHESESHVCDVEPTCHLHDFFPQSRSFCEPSAADLMWDLLGQRAFSLLLAFVAACLARLSAVFFGFLFIKTTLEGMLAEWRASKREASGESAVHRLLSQVVEQEAKEALLAFHLLNRCSREKTVTHRALRIRVTALYARLGLGSACTLEISDAFAKLQALGISCAVPGSDGRPSHRLATPMNSFLQQRHARWTTLLGNHFQSVVDSRI